METITAEYLQEQKILHQNPNYGIASVQFAEEVDALIGHIQRTPLLTMGREKKPGKKLWTREESTVTSIKPLIQFFRNTARHLRFST